MDIELWEHTETGNRVVVLFDPNLEEEIAGCIPVDKPLAAVLNEPYASILFEDNHQDYDLIEVSRLLEEKDAHGALALCIRQREWVEASRIVRQYIESEDAEGLQDWISQGDWSNVGTPEEVAQEWNNLDRGE